MDPLILTIVMRALERLLVVLAGALAIYLGYRLFIDMPNAERGSGKVNLPGGISIFLSRVGPGVFFSLFGAAVIALALQFGVSFSDTQGHGPTVLAAATGRDIGAPAARNWSGMTPGAGGTAPVEAFERDRVVAVVAALNRVEAGLPADLGPTDRVNLKYALRDARVRLLISVWDPAAWGDAAAFRDWVLANEPNPPPPAVAGAAALYRQGRPNGAP